LSTGIAWADGSETLGPPSISIATGTGIAAAGTGMVSQPGTISIDVPAGVTIKQVLLYWEGFMTDEVLGDDQITIESNPVTGTPIGGPDFFFDGPPAAYSSTFRADITGLNLVAPGSNSLQVSDLSFSNVANGAGILVIFDDGSTASSIEVRDGNDTAFIGFPDPRHDTIPQTFNFAAADTDREAELAMFFSSVQGDVSGGGVRASSIQVDNGVTTELFSDLLASNDGDEWDTVIVPVSIPAGTNAVTVQAFSRDDLGTNELPASLVWNAAALAVPPVGSPFTPGRMTGGGHQIRVDNVRITRGFTIHCDIVLSNNLEINWPGNKWHIAKPLTSAECIDDPAVSPLPPAAPFDTFIGEGVGRLNGVEGSIVRFTFVDAGEPGKGTDSATISIWAPGADPDVDTPVLFVSDLLSGGNIQAHYDQPHK
jgi:hypothetical protein